MTSFVYTLHFLVCFILIGVVLLQRGKGADLGASLGGGGANTIFGSRGAGNFLTRITTGSAIIFMGTSLTLSYLGYQASDVRLFDENEPFAVETEGATAADTPGELVEIPTDESSGLVEIPSAVEEVEAAAEAAGDAIEAGASEAASEANSAVEEAAQP